MQPLNAIDAISPAFTRTHQILFRPFRLGRSFKFAITSYLALAGSLFIPFPLFLFFVPRMIAFFGSALPTGAASSIYTTAFVLTTLYVALFYFLVRLELVDYEVVATKAPLIAPVWRRHPGRVWPWLGLTVVLGSLATALIAPALFVAARHTFASLVPVFAAFPKQTNPGTPPDLKMILSLYESLFGFYAVVVGLFMIPKTLSTLANDFALPIFLMENATVGRSLQGGARLLFADPLQSLLYLVLKLVLSIAGFIAQYIATQVAMLPFTLLFVLLAVLGGWIAAHTGPAIHILLVIAGVALFVIFLVCVFYITLGTFGYLTLFLDAYGIFFVGSRYKPLGDLLDPSAATVYTYAPPPMPPSPGEDDDPDGGPSLPMDPAVA